MPTPEVDSAAKALVTGAGTAKTKNQNIQVSPAVLDAARKDGEELLQSLRTTAQGLAQTEAEERARAVGPNEVAEERKQGWPLRLLKIIRNPLVILLATLSAISFATGDARAGTVMAAVEKFHDAETTMVSSPTELKNTCFMGTSVESGTATAAVVATGVHTYLGSMASAITEEEPPTSFDQGLTRFTWLMIR